MADKTLIRGGFIIDGSGQPGFTGDILIGDGKILEITGKGGSAAGEGAELISAEGMIVCPGFIDMHRHCDAAPFRNPSEGGFGDMELLQGITTCMAGNCGMAPVPNRKETRRQLENYVLPCLGSFEKEEFSTHREYAERLEAVPLPLNMGFFAGMGALRIAVKGFEPSPYTKTEMETARALLSDALEAGAFGLSIGLLYVPEVYSSAGEIARLASVMRGGKGILCAHMRYETEKLTCAVEEVIGAAKAAEVPLEISHFKAAGSGAWGEVLHRAIDLIEKERAAGLDITVDFYPYDCGSSTMMQMLPPSFLAGNISGAIGGLDKPANVERLRKLLETGEKDWDNLSKTIGWDQTVISAVALDGNKRFLGKTVSEAARLAGAEDEAAFVAALMHSEAGKVSIINRSMSQADIDTIARLPYSSLISDSLYGDMKNPHPRLTGAFPRFLRDFVRERKILSPEEALRKMSALPAARLGLTDRGILASGKRADILLFNPEEFRDESTYTEPTRLASGLSLCLIGGIKVVEAGRVIRRDRGRREARPAKNRCLAL